jgi:hypothetical protein
MQVVRNHCALPTLILTRNEMRQLMRMQANSLVLAAVLVAGSVGAAAARWSRRDRDAEQQRHKSEQPSHK